MRFLRGLRLENRDLRWYRDKYLIVVTIMCIIMGFSPLRSWPPGRDDLVTAWKALGIAALCIVITPNRLFILLAALLSVTIRGIVGVFLYHSLAALIAGLIAGGAAYIIVLSMGRRGIPLSPPYKIEEYTYPELAIDVFVLLSSLWIYLKLSSMWAY